MPFTYLDEQPKSSKFTYLDSTAEEEKVNNRSSLTKTLSSSDKQVSTGDPLIDAGIFTQKEIVGPAAQGVNTALLGVPKYLTKAVAGEDFANEAFPQQSTFGGKVARFGSEATGLVAGGVGKLATIAGSKIVPKIGVETGKRIALRRSVEGGVGGALFPTENIDDYGNRVLNTVTGVATAPILGKVSDAIINKIAPDVQKLVNKHALVYRQILRPTQGEANKLEIKSGKDLNDFYKLAAKEGIIIKKSADNKLDTSFAREALDNKISALEDQYQGMLSVDKTPRFNLEDIKTKAVQSLDYLRKQNATDYITAVSKINSEIDDAINVNGSTFVNGETLNSLKRGWWKKGYSPLEPNSKVLGDATRKIGFIAKKSLENEYKNPNIAKVNSQLGEYLTLNTLLENAHNRVIQGGQIGRYTGRVIGAVSGIKIPLVGPIVGAMAGDNVVKFLANPERLTTGMSTKMSKALRRARIFDIKPNLEDINMEEVGKLYSEPAITIKPTTSEPIKKLPFIPGQPKFIQDRMNAPIENLGSGELKIYQNPILMTGEKAPLRLPFIAKETEQPLPKYLQERQNIPVEPIRLRAPELSSPLGLTAATGMGVATTIKSANAKEQKYKKVNPTMKMMIAKAENSGNTKGDWAQLEDIVLQDLKQIGKLDKNITLKQVKSDPELYDHVSALYLERLNDFGIPENKKALWWLMPGRYKTTGGDLNKLKPEFKNIMENRVKNMSKKTLPK